MTAQPPGKGRARIHANGNDLLIEIPAKANLFTTGFLGFWLCGWAMGELTVLGLLLSGQGHPFLLVWLCLWTFGGAAAIATFLWNIAGRERIWVTRDGVRIDRAIPVWSRSRVYDAAHISRMRIANGAAQAGRWFGRNTPGIVADFATGMIAFDYGRDTVRFGLELDEADARHVVETIGPRYT